MNNYKTIQLISLSVLALIFSVPSNAGVKSKTVEIDVIRDDVRIGKKVIVTCRNGSERREILKKNDAREWCDTAFVELCSTKKAVAAQMVCASDYDQKVSSKENADSDEVAKLKQELMEIELKRINIADKVLELKRRELQLQNEA